LTGTSLRSATTASGSTTARPEPRSPLSSSRRDPRPVQHRLGRW
jgi:hypothetical protein